MILVSNSIPIAAYIGDCVDPLFEEISTVHDGVTIIHVAPVDNDDADDVHVCTLTFELVIKVLLRDNVGHREAGVGVYGA